MLAVNIGSEGFMGVMWAIFAITGFIYFGLSTIFMLMGRFPRRP